jgi:class 3 adenylate cyclase
MAAVVPGMHPSAELIEVNNRFTTAMISNDRDALLELISAGDPAIFIGTDLGEWLVGRQALIEVHLEQGRQSPGATFASRGARAWSDGNVGFVVDQMLVRQSGLEVGTVRVTRIFHLEGAQWRCVHEHVSFGEPNEDSFGTQVPTSLESLASFAASDQPDVSGSADAAGTVTIAFTDIEASTEMAERLGDRLWRNLIAWHTECVNAAATRTGGEVVKSHGDGFMLVFPAASGALDFALDIQRSASEGFGSEEVRVRIGVNAGDATRDRNDFFGHAVTVAARVAAKASGGQVLATELVVGLVSGVDRFHFGPTMNLELKGLGGSYPARPLLPS